MSRAEPSPTAGELFSTASHELKTPLAMITGFAELLRARDAAARREAIARIPEAVQRLSLGIDAILTVFALDSAGLELAPAPVELEGLLAEASRLAESSRADVRCATAPPEPDSPLVLADPEFLLPALAALLASACAAQEPGSEVVVHVEPRERVLAISISAEQPWTGSERSRLGLYLAQRVAHLHGGVLSIEGGSSAALTVPLAARAGPEGPRRVLIVDDDEAVRGLLRETLSSLEGFEVLEAEDGQEALNRLRAGELPDLLVLDWRMPGRSGSDVLEELQQRALPVPVIVLTGDTTRIVPALADLLGASAFLTKPCSPRELLETVERLLPSRPQAA